MLVDIKCQVHGIDLETSILQVATKMIDPLVETFKTLKFAVSTSGLENHEPDSIV